LHLYMLLLIHFITKLIVYYNVFTCNLRIAAAPSLSIAFTLSGSLPLALALTFHHQAHRQLQCIRMQLERLSLPLSLLLATVDKQKESREAECIDR
jgi:hypothetical protein